MKIEAKTIGELIEKAGAHAGSLRKPDALIVRIAPQLERRMSSGPSIPKIGYGGLVWENMLSSDVWSVIAVALQKHHISTYVAAEVGGLPPGQVYDGKLGHI